jgi:hypothetical protein
MQKKKELSHIVMSSPKQQQQQSPSSRKQTPDTHLEKEYPFITEPFIDALYQPHTATILLIAIASLTYFAFLRQEHSLERNVKRGIVFSLLCCIELVLID